MAVASANVSSLCIRCDGAKSTHKTGFGAPRIGPKKRDFSQFTKLDWARAWLNLSYAAARRWPCATRFIGCGFGTSPVEGTMYDFARTYNFHLANTGLQYIYYYVRVESEYIIMRRYRASTKLVKVRYLVLPVQTQPCTIQIVIIILDVRGQQRSKKKRHRQRTIDGLIEKLYNILPTPCVSYFVVLLCLELMIRTSNCFCLRRIESKFE